MAAAASARIVLSVTTFTCRYDGAGIELGAVQGAMVADGSPAVELHLVRGAQVLAAPGLGGDGSGGQIVAVLGADMIFQSA